MQPHIQSLFKGKNLIPGTPLIRRAFKLFSVTEKIIFLGLIFIMSVSALILTYRANAAFLVDTAGRGGSFTEGIVGTPRFVNPILAVSDADKDISALVFSGLMRAAASGEYINDLADSLEISSDGLSYTVAIKENAIFHDGKPVTSEDVLFTIDKIRDVAIKSPRRANWEGVLVEKTDERTVVFTLRQPYAPFLDNLTLGILPRHVWEEVDAQEFPFSQHNIEAVGSGPYRVVKVLRNSGGLPQAYELRSFEDFALGRPFINKINIRFYSSESRAIGALLSKEVESLGGVSPEAANLLEERGLKLNTFSLPRVFAVFFNQNNADIFTETSVRRALALSAPRDAIASEVLKGFAVKIDSPVPKESTDTRSDSERLEEARAILERAGWRMNEETGLVEKGSGDSRQTISFSISTAGTPELSSAASLAAQSWNTLGMDVRVAQYESNDLQQNIIRERSYQALLFGEVVGRDRDLFPFWHSSQRNDPGLNVAMYASITADRLLDDLRKKSDTVEHENALRALLEEISDDVPAAFLYSPQYVYVTPPKIRQLASGELGHASDRFGNVYEWYIESERVWKIFAK